jgi:Zn-dependent M28 family amino/carboxypeptidase
VDSQRTPIIFTSKAWLATYQNFTTVAFVGFAAQVFLYTLGAITQWSWIWPLSAISAICAILLAAMCLQADSTPFTRGANDNATAAGLVLTLAEQMKTEPLKHTRIWLVCTGCEEAQHYGAIDFFRRHKNELEHPKALVFEMLGCGGPAWLTDEGIIVPFHADQGLVRLAEQISSDHPELNGYPTHITGGNTEMADALRLGIPAITITGLGPHGEAPYWHQVGDTYDKMDKSALARNYAFVWNMVQAVDKN